MSERFHPFGGRFSRKFGDKLSPDDAYLSYHDVRLTKGDVESIKGDWLTDNAICFWQEYLEHEVLALHTQAKIILLRPSMSYLLMSSPDPLSLKPTLPSFTNSTHFFLPINDGGEGGLDSTGISGSHWSLLLVSAIDGVAFHYDSLGSYNEKYAQIATHKLAIVLGLQIRFIPMDAPIQENSSDCGMYVCMGMRYLLLKRLLRADASQKVSMSLRSKDIHASEGRKEMVDMIVNLRKEGFKRADSRDKRSVSPFRRSSRSKSPPRIGPESSATKVST